jgi:hypothetical protein
VPVPTAADETAAGEGTSPLSERAPIVVRCEACGSDVATRHAFDKVTCSCGDVTVTGRPWRPTVTFRARAGSGWHELAPSPEGVDDDEPATDDAAPASRPLGYRP